MARLKPWVNMHDQRGVVLRVGKLYYRKDGRLVTEVCLGERYAHVAPGLLFNDEQYRGSYTDGWHSGPSGSLTDMVKWIREAEHPEYGCSLWMR